MTSRFRCSTAAAEQPMAGSAAQDAAFLLVEHPGPWGNQAFEESRLVPDEVKTALAAATRQHGIRIQLVRRPGERVGGHASYRVFLAHPTSGRLDVQELDDLAALATLELDLENRGAGWRPHDGSLVLVCTNGRRDLCCAELGRPVAQAIAAAYPEETWETTHLGGHRFAVAALTLPDGMSYGRLDADAGVAVAEAVRRGEVVVSHLRGRTAYPPAVQAAEVALLERLGLVSAGALELLGTEAAGDATVVTFGAGADRHEVTVTAEPQPAVRQSCADLREKPWTAYGVTGIRARAGSD